MLTDPWAYSRKKYDGNVSFWLIDEWVQSSTSDLFNIIDLNFVVLGKDQ